LAALYRRRDTGQGERIEIVYVAALDENGAIIGAARRIAGGRAESIFQPEWSPDGADLVFVSDRSGWWNLYRFTLATKAVQPIASRTAEFGQPQWSFGMATYAFAGPTVSSAPMPKPGSAASP
jgi:Tol biopolymer transport system component